MGLRIFHTADLHLGMRFAGYPEVQPELIGARFGALERMVERAGAEQCDLFVVAGDLFDRVTLGKSEVLRATQALNRFEGDAVLVLPGNHDYIAPDSRLWGWFRESAGDRVVLLDKPCIQDLSAYGVPATVFPCPCDSKHSNTNRIGWVAENSVPDSITIGIAHGSLEDVSPDFEEQYFPMRKAELEATGLDLWLLGHAHVTYPEKPGEADRIFNPGVPEPDGFDCDRGGRALIIDIDEDRRRRAVIVPTGEYRFVARSWELTAPDDIEDLEDTLAREEASKSLLKLTVAGRLDQGALILLNNAVRRLRERFFYVKYDPSSLTQRVGPELIDEQFVASSLPHRLLTALYEEGDESALQKAFELIQEVRDAD